MRGHCQPLVQRAAFVHLEVAPADPAQGGGVVHPQAQPLAVFGSEFVIGLRVAAAAGLTSGALELRGKLRYQACDEQVCFTPATADVAWTLRVVPANAVVRPQNPAVFGPATATAPPAAEIVSAVRAANAAARCHTIIQRSASMTLLVDADRTVRVGDQMKMEPVTGYDIAPGATLTLEPGGNHIMLLNLPAAMKAGTKIPVTLRFERAPAMTVEFEVRDATGASMTPAAGMGGAMASPTGTAMPMR